MKKLYSLYKCNFKTNLDYLELLLNNNHLHLNDNIVICEIKDGCIVLLLEIFEFVEINNKTKWFYYKVLYENKVGWTAFAFSDKGSDQYFIEIN